MKKLLLILVLVSFTACKQPKQKVHLSKITAENIAIDSTIKASKNIAEMIVPYKDSLQVKMQKELSVTQQNIIKTDGKLQSTLGNLVADACYKMANPVFKKESGKNIDFAMFNYGGLRASIPKGIIKTEHIFKLMPFENELVVVGLSGEKIKDLVTYFIQHKKAHPLSEHIKLSIFKNKNELKINNKPLNLNKTYYVLTTDFLQTGGDNMLFFKNPKQLIHLNYKMRDALLNYFGSQKQITAKTDERITFK